MKGNWESVEMSNTSIHSHYSNVSEKNKAAVFKWSPTQSVHHSNKAPERSGLPNDRFIQNSSYSVWDLNTSQQCTTTVRSDQRGHICGVVLEHREDNIGQRQGVWGPCLSHRRTLLKPQNTPVTKHTIERVAAQILKRFFSWSMTMNIYKGWGGSMCSYSIVQVNSDSILGLTENFKYRYFCIFTPF